MPMAICPMCGAQMHLNVAEPERFAAAHPERAALGCAVLPCLTCWREVAVGSRVRVRSTAARVQAHVGESGVVDALSAVGGWPVLRLKLDDGSALVVLRAEVEVLSG